MEKGHGVRAFLTDPSTSFEVFTSSDLLCLDNFWPPFTWPMDSVNSSMWWCLEGESTELQPVHASTLWAVQLDGVCTPIRINPARRSPLQIRSRNLEVPRMDVEDNNHSSGEALSVYLNTFNLSSDSPHLPAFYPFCLLFFFRFQKINLLSSSWFYSTMKSRTRPVLVTMILDHFHPQHEAQTFQHLHYQLHQHFLYHNIILQMSTVRVPVFRGISKCSRSSASSAPSTWCTPSPLVVAALSVTSNRLLWRFPEAALCLPRTQLCRW